ncbi:bifunctional hydroxymethylpyrimidine kinase/phosphomethylpyrimidine kinase [Saccharomycopsis crataegensis]|uniref:Bifunctional hydroxymethylpyrimidine kinase/phosphomethylpyrimidine kinase n=1 Tax=Saccharomycopsis crataegensis TaxID=43959 RepID=A0AAV5QJT7_9ASCO|nr:bifunctional hydroxymethylpyrimidine kinase/phosphomethylpyrimidine kinase [Saccharomycopsis crataegensis]
MTKFKVFEIHLYEHDSLELIVPLNTANLPAVLTVAGSDSSGGAGIEADLKTIIAHKCYGLTGITTLTAQNTTGVEDVLTISQSMMKSILDANFSDIKISSIKTGLLTKESIAALKYAIDKYEYKNNLVVDPVMVSTSGFEFMKSDLFECINREIGNSITIITPNLLEAKAIINTLSGKNLYTNEPLETIEEMYMMCRKIFDLTGIENILIKGGHQKWKQQDLLTDTLYCSENDSYYVFHSKMIDSVHTHGTGCTLSSAIASNMAHGLSIINAVANGIIYVQNGIRSAPGFGRGNGPLNHIQSFKLFNYEAIVEDKSFKLPFSEGEAFKFLFNHPRIAKHWQEYINHPFMFKVRDMSLPLEKFRHFIQQDYVYLINYSHIMSYLATYSTSKEDFRSDLAKLFALHEEMNKTGDIISLLNDDPTKGFEPNPTNKEYMEKLLDIATNTGDALDITTALTPCFHGYSIAAHNANNSVKKYHKADKLTTEVYTRWIDGNLQTVYSEACKVSEIEFNALIRKRCKSQQKLDRVIEIFETFTKLEVQFWSRCI